MLSIGIDAVEINRFEHWQKYKFIQLSHIFTASEIDYCLSIPAKSAERFAVRFAAKEAFYKAISSCFKLEQSTFEIFNQIEIYKDKQMSPVIKVNNKKLNKFLLKKNITIKLSLTHSKTAAISVVALI